MIFQEELINWYIINKRELPWRNTTDAYIIWLSEIILQQTRVEQGLPYFNKFLANFSTITSFANAPEAVVLKLWQGLGYYSRARNMLVTAKEIVKNHQGVFPTSHNQLIKLKGIGEYTAAAISSFAANEVKAVVDGNVFRVLARYFGIADAINSTEGKKIFMSLAQSLIQNQNPAVYNQAIMEFGALQCKPKTPNCGNCPLVLDCFAYKTKQVNALPLKLKKLKIKKRYFNYFIGITNNSILAKQRQAGDVWQHLYDFPLIETDSETNYHDTNFITAIKNKFGKAATFSQLFSKKHILTHQIIMVQFFALNNYEINFLENPEIEFIPLQKFEELPQPKVIVDFMTFYFN